MLKADDHDQIIKKSGRPDLKMSEQSANPTNHISPLARLFQIGRKQGYLTYDEIHAFLPEHDLTLEQLDRLFGALIAAGIPYGDEGSMPPESSRKK